VARISRDHGVTLICASIGVLTLAIRVWFHFYHSLQIRSPIARPTNQQPVGLVRRTQAKQLGHRMLAGRDLLR
jgi:hypothetical protein